MRLRLIRDLFVFQAASDAARICGWASIFSTRCCIAGRWCSCSAISSTPATKRRCSAPRRRHDVVAVAIRDPREEELPDVGLLEIHDAGDGPRLLLSIRHADFQAAYQAFAERAELFSNGPVPTRSTCWRPRPAADISTS